jgi:hypothetical protein
LPVVGAGALIVGTLLYCSEKKRDFEVNLPVAVTSHKQPRVIIGYDYKWENPEDSFDLEKQIVDGAGLEKELTRARAQDTYDPVRAISIKNAMIVADICKRNGVESYFVRCARGCPEVAMFQESLFPTTLVYCNPLINIGRVLDIEGGLENVWMENREVKVDVQSYVFDGKFRLIVPPVRKN